MQVFEAETVFFKEFGDPRIVSRKTGRIFGSVDELLAADASDGPATEILHFRVHNPRSNYGVPRWIGNLLAVLGSRQAEEVNFLYFQNKSVPPLAILVSGGRLSAQSIPRIESFIEEHIKGKKNFHKVLILEAEPAGGGGNIEHTGRLRIELRPLTAAQHNDALFQNYDIANQDKVGQSFRLPRLLRGNMQDFNRACYSADTETLTENGWKRHHDIGPRERIAVYDPARDELRFELPASKYVARVRETLYRFAGKHTDVLVTADHKMLVRCPERGWASETAAQVAKRSRFEFVVAPGADVGGCELTEFRLPKVCRIERGHRHLPIPGDLWLEFLGYFLSDGGLLETRHEAAPYLVFLRQKKPLYRGRMERCLDSIGWKYSTQVKEDGTAVFCISNRCLRDWLAGHCGGRSPGRHMPWKYATGLPVRQLRILFRAMMDGDGARATDLLSGAYHSASRQLADQVQAICVRLGLRSHVHRQEQSGVFRVLYAERRTTRLNNIDHVEKVPYEGEVYCFSCPGAGFFVTRRNGKVAVQGNTADAALHFAETQVFEPERQEFDFIVNRKVLADMGIRFWRFVSKSPVNRDPATMAEIIRGLVNANVITPEEARQLAGEVFNREFKKISAPWVKQPVPLTLAGVPIGPEEQSPLVGPEVPDDRPAPGALVPPGSAKRRRRAPGTDLAAEAERLIRLRDAMRQAEARAGDRAFREAKAGELETEVVRVPANEMRSWFEPEAPR